MQEKFHESLPINNFARGGITVSMVALMVKKKEFVNNRGGGAWLLHPTVPDYALEACQVMRRIRLSAAIYSQSWHMNARARAVTSPRCSGSGGKNLKMTSTVGICRDGAVDITPYYGCNFIFRQSFGQFNAVDENAVKYLESSKTTDGFCLFVLLLC